jgi:hypothetical protein
MERMIASGIRLDESGHVSVNAEVGRALFDIAIELEDATPHPVDVEHVLAAIVLAERDELVNDQTRVSRDNSSLRGIICKYLPLVFEQHGDQLGAE